MCLYMLEATQLESSFEEANGHLANQEPSMCIPEAKANCFVGCTDNTIVSRLR